MATLNMEGPYSLDENTVNEKIPRISAGNYALGYVKDGVFFIKYVGSSETDVNFRLKNHIGKYKSFKFSFAESARASFEKECQNFHDFGMEKKLDNSTHPERPQDTSWKCPACQIYGEADAAVEDLPTE